MRGHYTGSVKELRRTRRQVAERLYRDLLARRDEIIRENHAVTEQLREDATWVALLELIYERTKYK